MSLRQLFDDERPSCKQKRGWHIGCCSLNYKFAGEKIEKIMSDTTVTKVDSENSPTGEMGQKYLASGVSVAMRLWENEQPNDDKEARSRDYETVGYVLSGKAELELEGQTVKLEKGDSWVVPKGASHSYKIIESFTAVEATHPPAQAHGRDEE